MARPAGVRSATRYFAELESLRGVAISLVFFYHVVGFVDGTRGQALGVVVSPLHAFIHAGNTGVSLFFVLSAFLLSLPFLTEARGEKRVARARYYERRALRILPLYWAAVAGTTVLAAHRVSDLLGGLPYLVFLNALPGFNTTLAPYNSPWWSLATEVQFYLLLPLLPFFLRSRRGHWLGAAVLVAYALVYVALVEGKIQTLSMGGYLLLSHSLFGRAPLFATGILVAWLYSRHGEAIRARAERLVWARAGGADIALFGTLLALGYLLRHVTFVGYWRMEFGGHAWHVLEGALWGAVLFLLLLAPLRTKPIFSNRLLSTVGVVSYSIYLVHVPLLYVFLKPLHFAAPGTFTGWSIWDVGKVAVVAAACLVAATLTYWTIERPFLVRKEKL